jgi:hypothetical protein
MLHSNHFHITFVSSASSQRFFYYKFQNVWPKLCLMGLPAPFSADRPFWHRTVPVEIYDSPQMHHHVHKHNTPPWS